MILSRSVLSNNPDLVVLDCANDDASDMDAATVEAYIRRIWADNPAARVLAFNFFSVADEEVNDNVNHPANETAIGKLEAILSLYGVPLLDYWGTVQDLVNNHGHDLTEYMSDTIHPNEGGHDVAFALLKPYLLSGGGAKPATLPDRVYDANGDYENAPTIVNGTGYDSRTGSWTDIGTATQSNQVGATITFHATCQSIGNYRSDAPASTDVDISVDGGVFTNMAFYTNGVSIGARGPHTFIIRVKSGTVRIDEFWAI